MKKHLKESILAILADHENLNLGTVRPDGWPQVTTVSYVNDGLKLYFVTLAQAQKVNNIAHSSKVSLTIDSDEDDWDQIKGLSMSAEAGIVTDPKEIARVGDLMLDKFPQIRGMGTPLDTQTMTVIRLSPRVISVLDYTKGFGHTDLVQAS